MAEASAALDSGDEKRIEKKTAGEAERIERSFAAKGLGVFDQELGEGVMNAGGNVGANGFGQRIGNGSLEGSKEGARKGDMAGEAAIEVLVIEARSEGMRAAKHFKEDIGINGTAG